MQLCLEWHIACGRQFCLFSLDAVTEQLNQCCKWTDTVTVVVIFATKKLLGLLVHLCNTLHLLFERVYYGQIVCILQILWYEVSADRVPREVIRWAMCKLGVEEWLVSAVMSMYTGAKTVVRTVYSNSNGFEVKVDMHQGSALSPLLFVMVMEALSREFRVALPWELLYADDLVVIAETEEDIIKRLNEWKDNVENRGMRVNMNKTKVMISGERQKVTQKAVRWPCGVCGRVY